MTLQLVDDAVPGVTSASTTLAPTTHHACPLCEGTNWAEVRSPGDMGVRGEERRVEPSPVKKSWRVCETCGHIFSATFANESGQARTPEASRRQPGFAAVDSATQRQIAGRIVHRVCSLRSTIDGLWLDAVAEEGALLGAASEFGHDVLGLDSDPSRVASLIRRGMPAQCLDLEELDGVEICDVISLVNCLERTPFPGELLAHARRLLRPDGMLFLSLPNLDSSAWRELDASGTNPYWDEPGLLHCFSREHLYFLLRRNGFEPCDFAISEMTHVGMDVCAARSADTATEA